METIAYVETETVHEIVPMVTVYSIEERVETESASEEVVVVSSEKVREVRHEVVGGCGKGSKGEGCTKVVPLNTIVSYAGGFDTVTQVEKKVRMTTVIHEDEVQGGPAYRTEYVSENHESVRLDVETVPITLTVSQIRTKSETVTDEVDPGTVMKQVMVMKEVCPDDSIQSEKGCERVSLAAMTISCPPGSQQRHGSCVSKTSHTSTVCPPGSVEGGKGECTTTESIPAFADATPTPTKEKTPTPNKKKLRM